MTTITFENIATGKSQFNSASAKSFRDTLAKWHNASFEIADEINRKNDFVSGWKTAIETNQQILSKPERADEHEKRRAEIAKFEADIKRESELLDDFKKAQKPRLEAGEKLVTENLYNAYAKYATNPHDVELRREYIVAIAQWLYDNGVEPKMATCEGILGCAGQRKNNSKNAYKSGKHNAANAKGTFTKLFLGNLCDLLGDAIPVYKFKYVPVKLREKKDK